MSLQLQDEIAILQRIRDKGAVFAQNVENLRRVIKKHTTFDFFNNFNREEFEQIITGIINTTNESGESDEDNIARIDKLIEDRQRKRELLRKIQSGLLIRGLYGPTLSITYHKTEDDDEWQYSGQASTTEERFERLSRVLSLRAPIKPVLAYDMQVRTGGPRRIREQRIYGPYNSTDFFFRNQRS